MSWTTLNPWAKPASGQSPPFDLDRLSSPANQAKDVKATIAVAAEDSGSLRAIVDLVQ